MQSDDLTQPVPIPETSPIPTISIRPDDPDDEWAMPDTAKVLRVRYLTAILAILLLLGGGFWGGVVAEKHHGTGASSGASALAARFAALRAAGGFGGAGAAAGGAASGLAGGGATTGSRSAAGSRGAAAPGATGTVIDVVGNLLEISNSKGQIVKIEVGPSTPVTLSSNSSLSGLKIGDTVVVTGSQASGGTIKATAVRASASG